MVDLGSTLPLFCRGIYSLVSLEAAAAQPIPALLGIRPEKSVSHQLALSIAAGWIPAWKGVFHSQSALSGGLGALAS
jgi:hypothetical protein